LGVVCRVASVRRCRGGGESACGTRGPQAKGEEEEKGKGNGTHFDEGCCAQSARTRRIEAMSRAREMVYTIMETATLERVSPVAESSQQTEPTHSAAHSTIIKEIEAIIALLVMIGYG